MMKQTAMAAILILIGCQSGQSEESRVPQPYELTSRRVISEAANEAYKEAIESCYQGKAGDSPHGPQIVACLKQQLRGESETLAGAYSATVSFLKSSPDPMAKLRNGQSAWIKFRDENCAFARSVAPKDDADEFYYDCILRATIDRRVELRSLVGD
jgi:uncharacterized protein YecT (DUF1311 family)